MKMRFCVVPECSSNSSNEPDIPYHKFPSCPDTKRIWLNRIKLAASDLRHHTPQVCSKHFRKDDYMPLHKTCKRMLKKGAVPSTFAWGSCDPVPSAAELHQEPSESKQNVKPIARERTDAVDATPTDSGGLDDSFEEVERSKTPNYSKSSDVFKDPEVSFKSMIESENSDHGETDTSSVSFTPEKNYGRSSKHGDSKYLPGDRLEAKDLSSNQWYKAKVVEVDWEDEEILIHFEKWSQRFDEWIPMDSSRLRPLQSHSPSSQSTFRVGETVMASWSDNRKYAARIKSILSGDKYEVGFFDGFCKVVKGHKISKGTEETLAMDPGLFHNAGASTMTKAERRERKRKIGPVAELFQIKKKNSAESEKIASKKKSSGTSDSDTAKDESVPARIALTFDDRKKESDGKSRQRAFPVIKGFTDEAKSRVAGEKSKLSGGRRRSRHKVSSASIYDHPTAGSSKEPTTIPKPTRIRRRRDDIDPNDYDNWEPDGEEAWLVESAAGLRRSLKVKDDRLPVGWEKHTIQRKKGNSAGKWDVFLVSPTGRRFRSRKEMLTYFTDKGEEYKPELYDFTLRCSMRRKSTDGEQIYFKKKPPLKDSKHTPKETKPTPKDSKPTSKDAKSPAPAPSTASPLPPEPETEPPLGETPLVSPSRRVKTLLPKALEERGRAASPPPPHPSYQRSAVDAAKETDGEKVNDISARITDTESVLNEKPLEVEKSELELRSHDQLSALGDVTTEVPKALGNGFDTNSLWSNRSSSDSSSISSLDLKLDESGSSDEILGASAMSIANDVLLGDEAHRPDDVSLDEEPKTNSFHSGPPPPFHFDHDYVSFSRPLEVKTDSSAVSKPAERRDIVKGDCKLFASAVEFALCEMESCTREVVKLEIQQIFLKYSHSLANF